MNQPLSARWTNDELPGLFASLHGEGGLQVVLSWMVAGAKAWYRTPMTDMPQVLLDQRAIYAKQSGISDPIEDALRAAGFRFDPALRSNASDLNAVMPASVTPHALGRWLISRGCVRKRGGGVTTWTGVGI